MCKRTQAALKRSALVSGAGAITAYLVVEIVGLVFGPSVASSIGNVLHPVAWILAGLALAIVGVGAIGVCHRRFFGGGACSTQARR